MKPWMKLLNVGPKGLRGTRLRSSFLGMEIKLCAGCIGRDLSNIQVVSDERANVGFMHIYTPIPEREVRTKLG